MIKIAYYFSGNTSYVKELSKYDLTVIINDEKYIDELLKYNVHIKMLKYTKDYYDILVSNTDNIEKISARKKVVIGTGNKRRIQYIDKLDMDEILKDKPKGNIKFSIVVPNYDNADWIGKTIESVLNQTYNNWELYIIDDMSTDNSIEVIQKYKNDKITLIENEIKLYNGGSRNVGILRAKKSNQDGYLLFIDSDDYWDNNNFLKDLNDFINDEDLITYEYKYYMNNEIKPAGHFYYQNIDDLFMTIGICCACWCKAVKTELMPLFSFNTLMEDRVHHYRLINRINTYSHFDKYQVYVWNKMNKKSVTTDKNQKYGNEIQTPIEWDSCAYRHIADQIDLLGELNNQAWVKFIENKIKQCKNSVNNNTFFQL